MLNNFKAAILASAAVILLQNPAFAVDEYNVSKGLTLDGVPLGLHGVDSVALTSLGAVAEGSAVHTVLHDDAAYYFASQQSADTFSEDPEKYLPQYGGFCAYAVALGKKLDGDPRFADIVDGKLYLFVNDAIFQKYKENSQKILSKAEKMWPEIQHKAVNDL
ncbi:MAG: YHS domain-containing protein [Candidatus Competibacteraceae bacterium]|nr:YHS domain-containing protein [Candidatus Competibacteraceae bacterium]MCB1812567.1 YHS domain-containing protein [Candidatus Competibacteraceae bacterium]